MFDFVPHSRDTLTHGCLIFNYLWFEAQVGRHLRGRLDKRYKTQILIGPVVLVGRFEP
jgi:hypothetical protein